MVSMYLRRLLSAIPVCALILSISAAQARQTSSAITLFNNVRVFDGKGTSLSEPTNVLVRGNLIENISRTPIPADGSTTTKIIDGVDGNPLDNINLIADPANNFKIITKDGTIYKNTLTK
jgi:hypothetical protein